MTNTQAAQHSDLIFTIVATKVIDRPGCIAVNILKDRFTGQTGLKIVQTDWLLDKKAYCFR